MNNPQPKPTWYNSNGDTAYFNLTATRMVIHTFQVTDGRQKVSCHLRVWRHPRYTNRFEFHSTNHGPGRKDCEVSLSADDVRMMFDCEREKDVGNDIGFALVFHATLGRPGFFIRHLNRVNFPCPGTGLNGDPNFSFRLIPQMTAVMETMILTGKTM